ncbi:Quinone oxidoreductase 1 [Thermoflexales bacterium]|nr:Quinone oxidoreductase 1 [Thermoflexales bacterium]
MQKYRSVRLTRKGPPEVLQVVESDLREPEPGEARIKIQATGVGRTDVIMRRGYYPYAPKIPFVPGYEVVGYVDAVGANVSRVAIGDRVAALTVYGGYAEYLYRSADELVHVPAALDAAEAVTLILNYVTAYQMLHRSARVQAGQKALMTGASGGVGTALLQLGQLAGLKMYGTASQGKHRLLQETSATPIDYRTQDFVEVIQQLEPGGLDFVFEGLGGNYIRRGFAVLRRGGKLVAYGNSGFSTLLRDLAQVQLGHRLPNGKSGEFYGITALYRKDRTPFFEDLPILFKLLEERKLKPIIGQRFPLLEAARANALLESGQASGKIVLLAPELLSAGAGMTPR